MRTAELRLGEARSWLCSAFVRTMSRSPPLSGAFRSPSSNVALSDALIVHDHREFKC